MKDFRKYLLTEETDFLAQKIGDVVTALQTLEQDAQSMGNRQLINIVDNIVSQIRRILTSSWSKEETVHLKVVQKAAVALARAADKNEKMPEVISGVKGELENLLHKLNMPINRLGTTATPIKPVPSA